MRPDYKGKTHRILRCPHCQIAHVCSFEQFQKLFRNVVICVRCGQKFVALKPGQTQITSAVQPINNNQMDVALQPKLA